jgi:hypothetical protein
MQAQTHQGIYEPEHKRGLCETNCDPKVSKAAQFQLPEPRTSSPSLAIETKFEACTQLDFYPEELELDQQIDDLELTVARMSTRRERDPLSLTDLKYMKATLHCTKRSAGHAQKLLVHVSRKIGFEGKLLAKQSKLIRSTHRHHHHDERLKQQTLRCNRLCEVVISIKRSINQLEACRVAHIVGKQVGRDLQGAYLRLPPLMTKAQDLWSSRACHTNRTS